MKKSKTIFGKIIIVIIVIFIFLAFNGEFTSTMSASSDGDIRTTNSRLRYENSELKKEYLKLTEKLVEMETLVNKIHEYDNVIYSQYLGVDFDTTDFHQYRNDLNNLVLKRNNTLFSIVSDRAFYAAEMLATQLIKLQETSTNFKKNKNTILYYPTISPIKTRDFVEITSPYGWREHPIIKNKILFHEGVDIAARVGTSVYSTAQGRVVKVLYSKYGYGNRIVIKHAYGFETLYAHLSVIRVRKGQWINKNQLIGSVGNSGLSTGPHLHYEIRKNNESRDPLGYFYTHIAQELLAVK